MSGRGSVIIQYQLEDKQFAHDKYLMYLSEMKMMERMSSVTVRKAPLRTWVVLSEHGEKLSATIALKELHRTLTPLEKNGLTVVDACIKRVLAARKLSVKNTKLTEQDLFYREVSSVDDIFWAMKDYIAEQWQLLGNNKTSQQWVLYGTTSVVKEMLGSAISYRGRHLRFYENVVGITSVWTFDASVKGVRSAVYAIIAKVFSDIPVDGDVNQQLWMLAADITDLVLSEYLQLLTVVEDERERAGLEDEFRRERSMWIQPFVAAHQLKMAAELAEKYKDFRTLVEVCDVSRNRDQLSKFVDQYHKEGFHKVLYSYYIEKGKYSLLFDQPLDHADLFTNYLVTHGNPNLQWVNGVNTRDYETSTAALNTLAADEELLPKKKTLLSLAKLCSLLKKDNEEKGQVMGALDQELRCVALQEKIPAKILRANGIDPQAPKVLSTEDIIDCYTKPYKGLTLEENLQLFMCALDLANLHNQVDSTAAHQLKVFIWVRAILKDRLGLPELFPHLF
jgi:nuclear pore complex protein Nup133